MKDDLNNIREGVRVVKLGLGIVVSNWGMSNGVPSVFLEPVLGEPGQNGQKVEDGREPQIKADSVSHGGIIFELHDPVGVEVFIEDLRSAIAQTKSE
jgi:hypothetical protein